MMNNHKKIVESYCLITGDSSVIKDVGAIFSSSTPYLRSNLPGHIVTSAVVLDPSGQRVLLVKHNFLDRFIQPGGHVDSDESLVESARRELAEETGYKNILYLPHDHNEPDVPLDIDIQTIPANPRKNEPEHYHYDFRYLFVLGEQEDGHQIDLNEVGDLIWLPISEKHSGIDAGLRRALTRASQLLQQKKDQLYFHRLEQKLNIGRVDKSLVLVTHLVPDVVDFVFALERCFKRVVVIPKPNSVSGAVQNLLDDRIVRLSREDLSTQEGIAKLHEEVDGQFIVVDVGGYFANKSIMDSIDSLSGMNLIVEDTENGHQRYDRLATEIRIPVCSVARSPLKLNEDDLVGYSVGFYAEQVVRRARRLPRYMQVGVIGYGRLGKGIARYLTNQNIKPLVYDVDPIRMVEAYKDGCLPSSREYLLGHCDLIFGATGAQSIRSSDLVSLKEGVFVASVTSSDDEFDFSDPNITLSETDIPSLVLCSGAGVSCYLINGGNAVNFIDPDGERVGDFIRLVQGEILAAIAKYLHGKMKAGFCSLEINDRQLVASTFIESYLPPISS